MRMDGERRAWRRTAAIAGLLALCSAGAAQADSPGSAQFRAQSALSGGAPIYDAGRANAPIYSPGDRPPSTTLYGAARPPVGLPPSSGAFGTGSVGTGPIYNPPGVSGGYLSPSPAPIYAQPSYAPIYQAPPPPPPAWAKDNDAFGYAPSAACGGLLEGERCLVILGDHTRRVRLDREAATILVGNPAVADVTVLSKRTMFVSARSVGSTNIVALDEDENEIASWEVFVREPEAKRVTLRQGAVRENYQCAPYCERSLSQNDSPSAHSTHLGVISAEMGLDRSAVGAQSGGVPPDAFQQQAPAAPPPPAAAAGTPSAVASSAAAAAQALRGLGGAPAAAPPQSEPNLPPPDYLLN